MMAVGEPNYVVNQWLGHLEFSVNEVLKIAFRNQACTTISTFMGFFSTFQNLVGSLAVFPVSAITLLSVKEMAWSESFATFPFIISLLSEHALPQLYHPLNSMSVHECKSYFIRISVVRLVVAYP